MSESDAEANQDIDPQAKSVDPKQQMRAALDAKKAAAQGHAAGRNVAGRKTSGGPHGQQGGKREFRRKAGG